MKKTNKKKFMKRLLSIILLLIFGVSAFAQTDEEIKEFGKKYYDHYKKKDFDWIMKNFISEKDYISNYEAKKYSNPKTKQELRKVYTEAKVEYRESLEKEYGSEALWKTIQFVQVLIEQAASDLKRVKIVFEDGRGQKYYLNPGILALNKKGRVVVFYNKIYTGYHGKWLSDIPSPRKYTPSTITIKGDTSADLPAPSIPGPPPVAPAPKRFENDNKVWEAVEQYPEFPGGEDKMIEWLKKNVKYPKIAKEAEVTGTVFIQMIVNKDGSLSDFKVIRDIGGGCGKAALNAIKKMPKWKPGFNEGTPVRVSYIIPYVFELEE